MTAAEARAERAKKLRYKRPACLNLNWNGIREDLSEMSEDIGSAQWMDGTSIMVGLTLANYGSLWRCWQCGTPYENQRKRTAWRVRA